MIIFFLTLKWEELLPIKRLNKMITYIYKCNYNGKIIPNKPLTQNHLKGVLKFVNSNYGLYKHRRLNKIKIEYYMHQSFFPDENNMSHIIGKVFRSMMCDWIYIGVKIWLDILV